MVSESTGLLERMLARIGAEGVVLFAVEVGQDGQTSQGVSLRAAGRADFEVPELLAVGRDREIDERGRELAVRRTAQEADRVGIDRRSSARHDESDPRWSAVRRGFALKTAVEVDAHPRGRVAGGDVEGD